MERAVARIDLGALRANCERLRAELGEARLCAVVKADGYGHGAVDVRARRRSPAARPRWRWRPPPRRRAGGGGCRRTRRSRPAPRRRRPVDLLTLGALTDAEVDVVLGAGSAVSVWTRGLPRARRRPRPRRSGAPPASTSSTTAAWAGSAPSTARRWSRSPAPSPPTPTSSWPASGPTSPPPTNPTTTRATSSSSSPASSRSPRRSTPSTPGVTVHAANSAAVFRSARSHFDMARCGVAIYGLDPFQVDPAARGLAPVLSLRSYVAAVKRFPAGQSAGYGRRWRAPEDTWVGVVPLGYGDGVRRALTNDCDVLVGGRRYPLVGTVSMDNLTIDLGPETDGRARRRGGADRPPGRGGDPRRGDRRPPRHDQLRDHLRDLPAGAAERPRVSLADDLRAAPLPAAAIRALGGGEGVWIAGGAVRDAALGRDVADLDLAVAGDPGPVAKALARELGEHAFELSAEFGTWRVVAPSRGWQVDVTALRGDSIEADLAARDFTVGAVAVPLAGGEAIDPTGGLADLERGVLRAVGPRQLRGGPAAPAARRPPRRRPRPPDRPRHRRPRPGERRARRRARRRAPAGRAAPAARRPRPAARPRAARRAPAHRRRPARAGGDEGRRTGPQPPPRRARPHARGARAHAGHRGRPRPLRRRGPRRRGRRLPRRAARRRDGPRHRAALRRPPPRHRQARDPAGERRLRRLQRPRRRGRRRRSARSWAGCAPPAS